MIELENVTRAFGANDAVADISLSVPKRAFLTLLGPSGCGKSTLLRMLAGLDRPTSGRIRFDDRIVAGEGASFVPPAGRNAGLVFQSYALWPHMTVSGNIEWPLKVAGLDRRERRRRMDEAMRMLAIETLADRFPGEISGGQQQRVALARMIAPRPAIMLFDEPLSNLDATLRVEMRFELMKLHAATGATTVYVTHDQVEAMTMASHVAVLNKGRLEQFDKPENLLEKPASAFVAGFVGTPPANLIPVSEGRLTGTLPGWNLPAAAMHAMVRAEDITLAAQEGPGTVKARLAEVAPMAGRRLVTGLVAAGDATIRITAVTDAGEALPDMLHFRLPETPAAIFDAKGQKIT